MNLIQQIIFPIHSVPPAHSLTHSLSCMKLIMHVILSFGFLPAHPPQLLPPIQQPRLCFAKFPIISLLRCIVGSLWFGHGYRYILESGREIVAQESLEQDALDHNSPGRTGLAQWMRYRGKFQGQQSTLGRGM